MSKYWTIAVLLGWFFGLQIPHPDTDGGGINVVIGPFRTEMACKADLPYAQSFFEQFFANVRVTNCAEKLKS